MPYLYNNHDKEKLLEIKIFLQQNLHLRITTRELCRKAEMNRNKLNQGFTKLHGTTIAKLLRQLRMEKAKELLVSTEISIEEIAESTGYNHYSNFLIAYKKYHRCSPGEERRKASNHSL